MASILFRQQRRRRRPFAAFICGFGDDPDFHFRTPTGFVIRHVGLRR